MKIVHILPSLNLGGAEKFTVDLANELAERGDNEVHLIVLQKISNSNILIQKINDKVILYKLNKTSRFSFKTIFQLMKLLYSIKPNVIHTHLRSLIYASPSIILYKIPTLHTIHSLAEKEVGSYLRIYHKFLFKKYPVYPVSITQEVLNSVQDVYGKQYDFLVFNGIKKPAITESINKLKKDLQKWKKNKKTKIILNIARINQAKNQLMLIDIFNELNENAILLIIGEAEKKDFLYFNQCLNNAKNNDKIHFIGAVSNIGDYLYVADALCLSSIYEGLPLVVLEAMSMGKPIISTPAGGIPDVIKNEINGLISKDFQKNSLCKILKYFINDSISFDPDLIKSIYKERYSIEKTAEEYNKLYKKISISAKNGERQS